MAGRHRSRRAKMRRKRDYRRRKFADKVAIRMGAVAVRYEMIGGYRYRYVPCDNLVAVERFVPEDQEWVHVGYQP